MKRFLVIILCLATVFLASACGKIPVARLQIQMKYEYNSESETETVTETETETEAESLSLTEIPPYVKEKSSDLIEIDFSSYAEIVDSYRAIVDEMFCIASTDEIDRARYHFADDGAKETFEKLIESIFYFYSGSDYAEGYYRDGRESYGYSLSDINGDGVDELFLMNDAYEIIAIFVVDNGASVLLEAFGYNGKSCYIDRDYIYIRLIHKDVCEGNSFCYTVVTDVYKLNGAILEPIFSTRCENANCRRFYKIINEAWIEIDENEWLALSKMPLYNGNKGMYNYKSDLLELTHLYGPLKLVIQKGISWDCFESIYSYGTILVFNMNNSVSDNKISFAIYYVGGRWEHKYSFKDLERVGDRVFFDAEGVSGKIEFALNGIWFTVYEDKNEFLNSGTVFYSADYISLSVG